MGRKLLPTDERKSSNLALRLLPSLMEQIEHAIDGRRCNKTEFVVGLIEAGIEARLAPAVIDAVEAPKLLRLNARTRDELLKQLQFVEEENQRLRAALESLDTTPIRSNHARVIALATAADTARLSD